MTEEAKIEKIEKEHECERRKGKIWEVAVSQNGTPFCMSCGGVLEDWQIHPPLLEEIKTRFRQDDRNKRKN